jgi:uncharacterized protein YfaS (alpha-2-macroglobulin family)
VRTSAIALSALVEVAPNHPLIGRLADGLLAARRNGRWDNTQENVYALVALADFARARKAEGPARVRIALDGKALFDGALAADGIKRIHLPLARARGGKLTIESSGHPVHYSARLRLARPADAAAKSSGLDVERRWIDPASGAPVEKVKLGQVVKVVVTVRTDEQQAHVAVVDRLPAGLEPVLDRFDKPDEEESVPPWWIPRARTTWVWRQLHDDRVEVFADLLASGSSEFSYFARATTAGTFVAPPATAELMYQPARFGRSAGGSLEVTR